MSAGPKTASHACEFQTNWNLIGTLAPRRSHFADEKPRLSGAFSYSGGGIRTRDLRVMSPTSYQTAPPRGALGNLAKSPGCAKRVPTAGRRIARMARCFVTRRLPGSALERLAAEHEMDVWSERLPPPPAELRARTAPADGLLSLLTDPVDADVIASAPRLRVISNYAVGVDNVDLAAARERGIRVGNTPDVLTDATADLAFALLLAVARRLPDGANAVRAGEWLTWEPDWLLGHDVHRATLGIVGMGRIGRAVARRAEGFEMEVLSAHTLPLHELLARADFVSLHVPLTPQTRHLIDADALRRMKSTAYLVN